MASPAAAAASFSDNFEAGASRLWGNEQGAWSAASGLYDAAFPSNFPSAHSSLPFVLVDFTIELDVIDVKDGGVWLRSSAAPGAVGRTGVLLVTGGNGGTGTGLYWHAVTSGDYGSKLNEQTGLFASGVSDAHLRIVVEGDVYSVYLDGAQSPATTLTTSAFGQGQVALYDFSTQRFDNVVVTPVPEPQAAMLFALGLTVVAGAIWGRRRKR
jgi:hypothetical protein